MRPEAPQRPLSRVFSKRRNHVYSGVAFAKSSLVEGDKEGYCVPSGPHKKFVSLRPTLTPKSLRDRRSSTRGFSFPDQFIYTEGPFSKKSFCTHTPLVSVSKFAPILISKYFPQCKDLKKSCRVDSDCSCSGYQMKCELEPSGTESECVIINKSLSSLLMLSKRRISRKNRLNANEIEQA